MSFIKTSMQETIRLWFRKCCRWDSKPMDLQLALYKSFSKLKLTFKCWTEKRHIQFSSTKWRFPVCCQLLAYCSGKGTTTSFTRSKWLQLTASISTKGCGPSPLISNSKRPTFMHRLSPKVIVHTKNLSSLWIWLMFRFLKMMDQHPSKVKALIALSMTWRLQLHYKVTPRATCTVKMGADCAETTSMTWTTEWVSNALMSFVNNVYWSLSTKRRTQTSWAMNGNPDSKPLVRLLNVSMWLGWLTSISCLTSKWFSIT